MDNALAVAVTKRVAAECLSRGMSRGRNQGVLIGLGIAAFAVVVVSSTGNSRPQPETRDTRPSRGYTAHDYMLTQRTLGGYL